jgi:3-isopropylmalate dehydrogenase
MIEKAVSQVLAQNYRTADIMSRGKRLVGTKEMGRLIVEAID